MKTRLSCFWAVGYRSAGSILFLQTMSSGESRAVYWTPTVSLANQYRTPDLARDAADAVRDKLPEDCEPCVWWIETTATVEEGI